MSLCTIDFETFDKPMSEGFGAGWVFNLNHDNNTFRLLGASIKIDDQPTTYSTDPDTIKNMVLSHKNLIMHNALYDLGCLLVLFKDDNRFNLRDYTIYDTMIMAKLHDQSRHSYSLDNLGKDWNLKSNKDSSLLYDYAWESGIYIADYKEVHNMNKQTRPSDNVLEQWCKSHMDKFPDDLVGQYANLDVDTTYELFNYLKPKVDYLDLSFYSTLLKITVDIKRRGINVDLKAAREAMDRLGDRVEELKEKLFTICGETFNLNSTPQIVTVLKKIGITNFAKTDKGTDSIAGEWMNEQPHEACKLLSEIRETKKIREQFIGKVVTYQSITGMTWDDVGIIYPTFKLLGATKTGRFSSGGGSDSYELNMQQIPARNPILGGICRSLFIPPKGSKWISADYSNQEQRLQVHYASEWNMPGVEEVVLAWNQDPELDYHSKVAEMVGFLCPTACKECSQCKKGRRDAKTINLGLSYGMGAGKLCVSLGLPTDIWRTPDGKDVTVAGPEGKSVLEQYHTMLPFMKKLQDSAANMLSKRGFVVTIGGRRVHRDNTFDDRSGRNGLNKLIQGSAADQLMKALVNCYDMGLEIRCTVHDEICITSCNPDEDVLKLNRAMSDTYLTHVPMIADIGVGDSWGGSK